VDDPVALEPFWAQFEAWSPAERAAALAPVMNKLRNALLRRRVRNALGQAAPPWSFRQILDHNGILFVSLAKGLLGDEASALVGSLVLAQLWNAVQARASQPQSRRLPVHCYVDELQDFMSFPTSLEAILNQARALGLGLTVAHQNLAQLPRDAREALLANARSKVVFQLGANDARVMARELGPQLTPEDIQGLGKFEIVAAVAAGSRTLPPVTATTTAPPQGLAMASRVRQQSRALWGRPRAEVEQAIRRRYETPTDEGPIGIRRRRS
jgi:hypothetical protein